MIRLQIHRLNKQLAIFFGKDRFVWGGCSDDIKYGMEFSRNFVDATERDRHDARANMNRHNNQVGRKVSFYFVK